MTKANFPASLKRVLVHEGGKVDDPRDPGGRTNQGVTQRVYDMFRQAKKQASRDVFDMTSVERDAIYKQRYWDAVKGDDLPSGVDYVVFDGAVNSGPGQSVKWLQRALGAYYTGKVDGFMGQSTIAAVKEHPNPDALITAIVGRRLAFLKALRTWGTYGKGWGRRVADVEAIGQAMATGGTAQPAMFFAGGEVKAPIEDAIASPSKAPGDMATGGGFVSGALAQATDQLTPLSNIEFVAKVVAALTIAGIVVATCGIGYRWWAKRREAKLADALDRPVK